MPTMFSRMSQHYETRRGSYHITTDPQRLDLETIHDYLANRSYWAQGRDLLTMRRCVASSRNYGLYRGDRQVGYARAITDGATFAWICDVFVLENHRKCGLGKWLVESVLDDPELRTVRRWILATRDAHELYRRFGFRPLEAPHRWMILMR